MHFYFPRTKTRIARCAPLFLFLSCTGLNICHATVNDVLCHNGNGTFTASFRHEIKVSVGPQKEGMLARRVCQAAIRWSGGSLVVAGEAAQIDVDMFGVDVEANQPVAAFQIKRSDRQCCMTYQIYSLENPPLLLRTITGATLFTGADTDLDGRVEIWADDRETVEGFEGFSAREIQFIPTCVIRFEHKRLVDVSAEFRPYFDEVIATVKAGLNDADLRSFLKGGRLQEGDAGSARQISRVLDLRAVKLRVLEIVWAYLYSGREQQAWESLKGMWPHDDFDRIRSRLLYMRIHGIQRQLDGVLNIANIAPKRHARIYRESQITPPQPILLGCYVVPCGLQNNRVPEQMVQVNLVIDSAGKVRSVESADRKHPADEYVLRSAQEWKFIPAFKAGHSVASRFRSLVALTR
jgi:hypothetical protein